MGMFEDENRRTGRTTRLLKLAKQKDAFFVVLYHEYAKQIKRMAFDLGFNPRRVLVLDEETARDMWPGPGRFVVDHTVLEHSNDHQKKLLDRLRDECELII